MSNEQLETVAAQLREWADSLDGIGATDEMGMRSIISGMREVAMDLDPKEHIVAYIEIIRVWSEEARRVGSGAAAPNPIESWWEIVCEEFADAAGELTRTSDEPDITLHGDGDMTVHFEAELSFSVPGALYVKHAGNVEKIISDWFYAGTRLFLPVQGVKGSYRLLKYEVVR